MRQEASAAIRALFGLNPGQVKFDFCFVQVLIKKLQFAAALQELPKPFQEGANKALRAIETDSYGGGDYRTESPEIQKYPRSQSSMAGKLFDSKLYSLSFSHSTVFPFSGSLESDNYYMTYRDKRICFF